MKRAFGQNVLAQILHNLVPLALLPIYTRLMDQHAFGIYTLLVLIATGVSGVLTTSVSGTLSMFFIRNSDRRRGIAMASLLGAMNVAAGIAAALAAAACFLLLGQEGGATAFSAALVASLMLPLATVSFHTVVMRLAGKGWYLVSVELAYAVCTLSLGVTFVAVFDWGLVGAALAISLGHWIMAAAALWNARQILAPRLSMIPIRRALPLVRPLLPYTVLNVMRDNGDRLILAGLGGASAVAVYGAVMSLSRPLNVAVGALSAAITPRQYKVLRDLGVADGSRVMAPSVGSGLAVIVVLWSALALFGRDAVAIILPPEYHHAWSLLLIFSAGYVARYFWTIDIATVQHAGRQAELPGASLVALIGTVVVAGAGVSSIGLAGAALAFAAGHVALAWSTAWIASRSGAVHEARELVSTALFVGVGLAASLAALILEAYPMPFALPARVAAVAAASGLVLLLVRHARKR